MPGIVRGLLIYAAVDALVVQPLSESSQRRYPGICIDYRTHGLARSQAHVKKNDSEVSPGLRVHGIVGLLNVFRSSWLIAISDCRHVAQIYGRPVFLITGVVVIPLSSQREAQEALFKANSPGSYEADQSSSAEESSPDVPSDAESGTLNANEKEQEDFTKLSFSPNSPRNVRFNSNKDLPVDVVGAKGLHGYLAERWRDGVGNPMNRRASLLRNSDQLSSRVEPLDRRKLISIAAKLSLPLPNTEEILIPDHPLNPTPSAHPQDQSHIKTYLPLLLETTKRLLTSQTFYFSHEYDITKTIERQSRDLEASSNQSNDSSQYMWNAHLRRDFQAKNLDEYSVPIMQGYVGQLAFTTPELSTGKSTGTATRSKQEHSNSQPSLLTLISRRSTNRAGFRYLRRGIDEDGNVANSVETEQILSSADWKSTSLNSFVQIRGSIPLLFTQLPYTFKPPPTIYGSHQANQGALGKHFRALGARYGDVHAVSLVDRHEPEVTIGEAYETNIKQLRSNIGLIGGHSVDFTWFDFHQVCSKMQFENVSQLVANLAPFLSDAKWTAVSSSDKLIQQQNGVIRTNCMDCLDRTNVVQSAIGLHIVHQQLGLDATSIAVPPAPPTTTSSLSTAFSTLWANNGDAISLAYTHTPALKGDYVRNHKRTAFGALADLSHTLHRYYRNLFDDFFAQAALDFVLGNVDEEVFAEFAEKGETRDLARDIWRLREDAIGNAVEALSEEERNTFVTGWVVDLATARPDPSSSKSETSPEALPSLVAKSISPIVLRTLSFEQRILLLTDHNLIAATYDWSTDQVLHISRLPLAQIIHLQTGAYITNTQTLSQLDPLRNVGVLVTFSASIITTDTPAVTDQTHVIAIKAPPRAPGLSPRARDLVNRHQQRQSQRQIMSEAQQVDQVVDEIARAVRRGCGGREVAVLSEDIVSADQARRSTGYAESARYEIRRMVWG